MKTISILSASFLLLAACSTKVEKENAVAKGETQVTNTVTLTKAQLDLAKLSTGNLSVMQMHKTIKVNGFMDVPPQNMLSVSIPMGGYVKKANLIPGEKVSKGAVLAVLEDASYVSLQQDYFSIYKSTRKQARIFTNKITMHFCGALIFYIRRNNMHFGIIGFTRLIIFTEFYFIPFFDSSCIVFKNNQAGM